MKLVLCRGVCRYGFGGFGSHSPPANGGAKQHFYLSLNLFLQMATLAVDTRKYTRGLVTRIYNAIDGFNGYSDTELSKTKLKLEKMEIQLQAMNEKVYSLKFPDDGTKHDSSKLEEELESCEKYMDDICHCQSIISSILADRVAAAAAVAAGSASPPPHAAPGGQRPAGSQLKSPVAPLPTFESKEGENLELFLAMFEDAISKFNYTEYDKIVLLKQQVSGRALLLIKELPPEKHKYKDIVQILKDALASMEVQKFNTIKQLSEMRLTYQGEPFQYYCDMRKIMQAFDTLKITVDDILTYFIYYGMNDSFRNQMTMVTTKTHPSLQEITDNFFKANERYELAQKCRAKSSRKDPEAKLDTNAYALVPHAAEENPLRRCTLCAASHNDHGIHRCTKYPTPEDKLERLKVLKGCSMCGNLSHMYDKCRFKFRSECDHCNKWHFRFLCPFQSKPSKFTKDKKVGKSVSNGKNSHQIGMGDKKVTGANCIAVSNENSLEGGSEEEVETHCQIVCASYFQKNIVEIDSILPTFSISSSMDKSSIRGMYDTASQSSFISRGSLQHIQHKVLRSNVKLTIKGINNVRTCNSELIEANLNFGDHSSKVSLLTVDAIDINLGLPRLGQAVELLTSRGVTLADRSLSKTSNGLSNIQLILGADAAHCFSGSTVALGDSSAYLESKLGVMLIGSISKLLADMKRVNEVKPQTYDDKNLAVKMSLSSYHIGLGFSGSAPNIARECNVNLDYDLAIKDLDPLDFDNCSSETLEKTCSFHLNKESEEEELDYELNDKLVHYLLNNCSRNSEGRLIFPLLWNPQVKHLLAQNYFLSKKILESYIKKYKNDPVKLSMIHKNVVDLEEAGIIEKVHDLDNLMKDNPTISFLPHQCIFKMDKETSKVRMVFMANLAEKLGGARSLSHSNCMYPGPNINQKLSSSILHLRFGTYLLSWDIQKAFLQILLKEEDSQKLLFLWFKNPSEGNFDIQCYKNLRLSFGLRCSPCCLMIALYKILVVDARDDPDKIKKMKALIYTLTYMDNLSYSSDSCEDIRSAYELMGSIFEPYKMNLQQYCSNDVELRNKIENHPENVGLFGLDWNTGGDTLAAKKKLLCPEANTKRKILRSLAACFDLFLYDGPVFNRPRLFLNKLQNQPQLGWDTVLDKEVVREWRNICKQINCADPTPVRRNIGSRDDEYRLVCFSDASKQIYAAVAYMQNLRTNEVSFILGKNRIVSKTLDSKSIPSLELAGLVLCTEVACDIKQELGGDRCLDPIKISETVIYTDSLICLNWINAATNRLEKLNKLSVFVKNRLDKIATLCKKNPVAFTFVDGFENPADHLSRECSPKLLAKSNYISGPKFLTEPDIYMSRADIMSVTVPNPKFSIPHNDIALCTLTKTSSNYLSYLFYPS